jgi:hypothetical protein
MVRIAAVNISPEDKDYLEQLRRKYPSKKIPNKNELLHKIILYIKEHADEFLREQKNEQ